MDELEAIITALEQNNTAIAEMVKSRDLIVDELNDRIAVFEKDKVVLKAALKQLQKEMKEEAPRTQKLTDDLDVAREGALTMGGKRSSSSTVFLINNVVLLPQRLKD